MLSAMGSIHITNVRIVTPQGVVHGSLSAANGRITSVYTGEERADTIKGGMETIDGEGGWLLPGFVDVHVHGGFGGDFMDAEADAYDTVARFHALHGTTTMLATTVTAPKDAIERVLDAVARYRAQPCVGARLAGVHLEGPFISPRWPGAQNPAYIVPPRPDWVTDWNGRYPGLIQMLTLAPELPGATALISRLRDAGIVAACGHTDADFETITAAVEAGLSHAVHTFNAMRGLHHREPGTTGAVLTCDGLSAEIIADGHHAHPAAVKLLLRAKQPDQVLLITDAISAAGLGDGEYALGGLKVTVSEGVARLADGGNLAGSTLTMLGAFRNAMAFGGLSPVEASRLASENPAKLLGLHEELGSIAPGKAADLVLLSHGFEHVRTWVGGRAVHPQP
ncbi:N-acetylglucosamine-6-phosphate deacetylase [Paenibacillus darwinianus]|uniref:N-acetylglucosamine-6-phosphate deacetylase n=1 Tax=Paenibacillus darwinianus TaxID=1380763 RepID=A0A9W5W7C7_9BACL|nr:N-acetylglucosamine-6-phosphate deacetylase [Paenibacillus darwinianus]EXX89399.1 N-acetylglucosamine-6-phosphate deacetylase [Paenibacillus darwinianus]EXX90179.1 N-acetylglucosamine-6-phosphate deacetylase [Paenibacillus darwinianus]EXX91537.1 N-acetylglucosamine-6-phosphate deacetylase [Paenibacillus darwinianus]